MQTSLGTKTLENELKHKGDVAKKKFFSFTEVIYVIFFLLDSSALTINSTYNSDTKQPDRNLNFFFFCLFLSWETSH